MVVGLTGGIGSGKSTVLKMFEKLGAVVYIADIEAKKLMVESDSLREKITNLFGESAFENGELNRVYISQIVFSNPEKLAQLNAIVHPAVHQHFLQFVEKNNNSENYIVYESALLIENKNRSFCESIILVTAPLEVKINRVMERDAATKEQILNRMKNQSTDEAKIPFADFVIENISLEETEAEVLKLHFHFLNKLKA